MNGQPDPTDDSLPVAALERIDRICLEFESAWKTGKPPRIEDYLGDTEGAERAQLLRELLLLDLDYLNRSGERPTRNQYQGRFPQDGKLVEEVFERFSTDAARAETTPPEAPRPVAGAVLPRQFGDYELLELLGEGGMGVVYRSRQRSADRIVALKIIRPDRLAAVLPEHRQKAIERFWTEAQAAARLEHDHIVPVYEVGELEGQPFFSMRYIEGRSLDEVLRDGPMAGPEAAALLEPIARAVHYAHGREIIHRDLKPRNILLDGDGRPYVADFGLAKSLVAAQDLTETREVIGTPAYMSPEQARGAADVDHSTDVYSLGATLYELLTGRPPFRAATLAETQRQVIDNEPVPPRQLNPAVPRDLETICLKCLEKERAQRYGTAEELADELTRFQEGRPIQAHPITRVARAWRWCKRNRAVASLGAVAAGLLLVLAIAGPIVAVRQTRLRHEADHAAARARTLLGEKEKALKDANEQRDRAETYLTMAMKALDEIVTRVGAKDLAYMPQMETVRRQVLKDAVEFYEILLEKETSVGAYTNTTALRGEVARAWLRVGEMNRLLGDNGRAKGAYDQAIGRLENLVKESPGKPEYRLHLAMAYNGRSAVLASAKRVREAEKAVDVAIQLGEELQEKHPNDPDYAYGLAGFYHQRGSLLREYHPPDEQFDLAARLREGEHSYSKALEIIDKLVERNPEVSRYKDALATMCRHEGERAIKEGRFTDAKEAYRQGITWLEGRVRELPYSPSLRHALAMDYMGLAHALAAERQWQEAQQNYAQAVSLEQRNRNEYPLVPEFRNGLAAALHGNAKLLYSQGKLRDARPLLEQAVTERLEALKAESNNPIYRGGLSSDYSLLVRTLVRLGDHAAAADAALQFAQVYDKHSPSHFVATNFLVACARLARANQAFATEQREKLAQDYLELAKQMLDEAVADTEARPDVPLGRMYMAFFLAEPPEPELRDAARAVKIAQEVFDQLPDSWFEWFQLAVIHYRAGNWKESLDALNEVHARKRAGTCTTWALLAMALWQSGHEEEARGCYSKLVARMEHSGCQNPEHHRYAREAAELLGLAPPRVSQRSATADESPDQPLTDLPGLQTNPFQEPEQQEPLP